MLDVIPIPAFNDNYLWLFKEAGATRACIVDPGDARPVLEYLHKHDLTLAAIFVTHHHGDHTGGIKELLSHYDVPVYGPDSGKIPQVNHVVKEGDEIKLFDEVFHIAEIPGHTLDHIAYYTRTRASSEGPVLFCGDTLFAGGCGRVFEGTYPMMHSSLQKLAALDPDTQVYCAHEYTLANLSFAAAVSPDDAVLAVRIKNEEDKRARNVPTVPTTIACELTTNPFLRCQNTQIMKAVNAHSNSLVSSESDVFGLLRQWKDSF